MNTIKKAILIALGLSMAYPSVGSPSYESQSDPSRFYERKEEGWFWYNEEEPDEPFELEEEPQVAAQPEPEPETQYSGPIEGLGNSESDGPEVLSAEWFRVNLPKYLDAAWENPTIENVRAYMYLQRYAIDRSEEFSDVSELAVVGDPFLDEESRRPSATFASQKLDKEAGIEKESLATKVASKAGIFFFYESDSQSSQLQAPIIKRLEAMHGFTVLPIAIDGEPLPGGIYPNFQPDSGQAEKMGVESYPAIYLVSENREVEPVAQSVLSLAELRHRVILVAKRRGWVSNDEFNKARPIRNLHNNLAAILDAHAADLSRLDADTTTKPGEEKTRFISPDKISDFIRKNIHQEH